MIPKIIAIIGATCSGKTSLSLQVALDSNSYIFSLDSVSIYKEINIASAKPSRDELERVRHFGINVLSPNESVSAGVFLSLLREAINICKDDNKNLIVSGGFLYNIDSNYAKNISSNDRYRITKGIEIFSLSNMTPSRYFARYKKVPFEIPITIFNLVIDKQQLHKNIAKRTQSMIESGILEETKSIVEKYGRDISVLKSIGLRECLAFINSKNNNISKLSDEISLHTRQLAKRQMTFNRTQFKHITQISSDDYQKIVDFMR